MTYTYHSDGFRSVKARSAREAAEIFATRRARENYGRAGLCRTLRLDCWTENGRSETYEAFIGRPVAGDRGAITGKRIWLYVNR